MICVLLFNYSNYIRVELLMLIKKLVLFFCKICYIPTSNVVLLNKYNIKLELSCMFFYVTKTMHYNWINWIKVTLNCTRIKENLDDLLLNNILRDSIHVNSEIKAMMT